MSIFVNIFERRYSRFVPVFTNNAERLALPSPVDNVHGPSGFHCICPQRREATCHFLFEPTTSGAHRPQ